MAPTHFDSGGFNTNILSLVDRGFIWHRSHPRGQEKGRRWYNPASSTKDQYVPGFIAARTPCRSSLHPQGAIVRRAAARRHVDGGCRQHGARSVRAIVAEVPFVDVLTTMLDDTRRSRRRNGPEWGNPIQGHKLGLRGDRKLFAYDRVEAKAYPHILALGGLTDPRVPIGSRRNGWRGCASQDRSKSVVAKTNMGAATAAPRAASTGSRKGPSSMPSGSKSRDRLRRINAWLQDGVEQLIASDP